MNKIIELKPFTISQDEYNALKISLSEPDASSLTNHYLATERSSKKERKPDDVCALWLFGDKEHGNKLYIQVMRYSDALNSLKRTSYNGEAIIQFRDMYYDLKINDASIEMIWSEYYDNYGVRMLPCEMAY